MKEFNRERALGMFEDGSGYWRDERTGDWLSTHPEYPNACGTIAARDANTRTRIPRDLLYGNLPHGSNPRQAGRPPLPPDQRRDHTLRVRCDDALADAVEEAARAEGLTVSAWIRRTIERAIKR